MTDPTDRPQGHSDSETRLFAPGLEGLVPDAFAPPTVGAAPTTPAPSPSPSAGVPTRLGPYRLLEKIGRGGMGTVYRARHEKLGTDFAVKVLTAGEFADADEMLRFQREAAAVARLGKHPHIVTVHDLGETGGIAYYAMELVEGRSLREEIARREVPPREAAALVEKVARALHFAHSHGIVHRDVKPDNIVVRSDGEPQVMDFGLASDRESSALLTVTGQIMGTLAYMAPEQASGEANATDARTDVYAVGGVLYELMTRVPPHPGLSMTATLPLILSGAIVPPRKLNAAAPRDLETICLKALALEPARRYQTAEAMADDLARFLAGEPILARPTRWPIKLWRKARRNRAAFALMVALAVLVLGGIAWLGGGEVRRRVLLGRATDRAQEALAAGRHDEAISSAQEAVRLAPSDESVSMLLAHARAEKSAAAGKSALEEYRRLSERAIALERERERLEQDAGEAKERRTPGEREVLWDKREELQQVRSDLQAKWVAAVTSFTQAYGFWNEHRGAMEGLADLYWDKYEEAERAQDDAERSTYEGLVRQFGREKYGKRLRGVRDVGVAFTLPVGFHGGDLEAYLFRYERNAHPPVLVPVPCDPKTGEALATPALGPCNPVPPEEAMPAEEVDVLAREADRLLSSGSPLEALPLYIELAKVRGKSPDAPLGQARCFGRLGDAESALGWLEVSIQRGQGDAAGLASAEDFAGLRSQPRFAALLAVLRGDLPRRTVRVESVCAGSVAERSGVLAGDVLLEANGAHVEDAGQFATIESHLAGKPVHLHVWRRDGARELELVGGKESDLTLADVDLRPSAPAPAGPGTRAREARTGSAFPLDRSARNLVALPVHEGTARLRLRLPKGSYLLSIGSQGDPKLADVRYPFVVASDMDWSDERAELPPDSDVPPGFRYVPAGPFRAGGDPSSLQEVRRGASIQRLEGFAIARYEVQSWNYLQFLNDRKRMDANAAFDRAPRQGFRATKGSAYWDLSHDRGVITSAWNWRPDLPVAGVGEGDVEEFAGWYAQILGEDHWRTRMPSEDEWEKAARGADGRAFPWGDVEDASFCCMADSRAAEGTEPYGLFPLDEGPYGVRDMAGGVREWCAAAGGSDSNGWVLKGGSWDSPMSMCHLASRERASRNIVMKNWGIRLVAVRAPR